ncbi:MAG: hydrogenase 4 subunit B [Eubacteriales bacterium]
MLLAIQNMAGQGTLFFVSILLYIFAAAASLALMRRHKLCNIVANTLCILAAAAGAAASIIKIFVDQTLTDIRIFQSTIPLISIDIKIDRLSAFFVLCLSVLVFCVSIYSIGYVSHYYGKRNVGLFNFMYATFILSMLFVMISGNAVFFFIAWEVMAMISYFLVVFEYEQEENQRAGKVYVIMTHIGTAFLLIGFLIMYSYTKSFDMFASSAAIPQSAKNIIFIMFLIGFGTKAGVIPVHIWLPHAHPAAPSNVSALMSGIMIKTAIYGILRFVFSYLGIQNTWWGVTILVIGIVSAVLGVAYAFVEKNIKRLLAYSSIENIGIIFIGLGVAFIAQAQGNSTVCALAITASLFHSFNHTLFKGSLFLGAGSVHYATHTKNMEELGGLIKKMPVTALFFLGGALSIAAVVPFNGFVSEWLTYQSLFATITPGQAGINILSILTVAVLAMAGALAAASIIKLYGISFLGLPRSEHASQAKEVPCVMNIGMGILVTLCLLAGLFPMAVLQGIDKVTLGLTGQSIIGQLKGGLLLAFYPMNISGNAVSPVVILGVLAGVILTALVMTRIIGGKYIQRKYGTWDCGFEALSERMQYSATGYSKPIKIVFKALFRPTRTIKIEGDLTYHPESIEYTVSAEPIFERYLYGPLVRAVKNFSKKIKFRIQTGSIHTYLIYIFLAVLALMLYNRLS